MDLNALAFVLVLGLIWIAYGLLTRKPSPFDNRKCMGAAWKKAFPSADADQVRSFLDCLVEGMELSQPKLSFHPNDKAIDIYRSLYGGRTPMSDECECETFLSNIEDKFRVTKESIVENVWTDEHVTLGEIFRFVESQ